MIRRLIRFIRSLWHVPPPPLDGVDIEALFDRVWPKIGEDLREEFRQRGKRDGR